MNLRKFFYRTIPFSVLFLSLLSLGQTQFPAWEYNPGPNPNTKMGRELIDLFAELPEYMELSDALMDRQKFRYIFGMMLTRTYFDENAVKILFVGQDATHIAEAAKQPGTSGFGARVQSVGNFFGVDQGISTTNAFLSTIKGQYGAFDHPVVEFDPKTNQTVIKKMPYVDNELWMLANGRQSEILRKRELFWEWMIRNNPKSLKLMILFGGAARDSFAEFLIGRGAKVGTRLDPERLKYIQVPESVLKYAGGNNEFPVPIDPKGNDVYEILVGRKLDYSKPKDQELAVKTLLEKKEEALKHMVFTQGGIEGSGVVNAAQLGGYDLDQVEINGTKTNSLKGLKLSDGTVIRDDLAFAMSPHPSSLSRMTPDQASKSLRKAFEKLNPLRERGWKIEPDIQADGTKMVNRWNLGEDYQYGRADIRPGYFEFGAPDDRRVSRAAASRLDPQTIVAGSRDRVSFDSDLLDLMKKSTPSESKNPNDLWSVRPRQEDTRSVFDRGPGEKLAKLIMNSLDRELIFRPKSGKKVTSRGEDKTFDTHGIDAFNVKTSPDTGFFGIHRGDFENFKVLVMADPHGLDDWLTARALTGSRGQYLHGFMDDLGIGEEYLVLKTVPVGMDGATAREWGITLQRTEEYREVMISEALKKQTPEFIVVDGEYAKKEMERILKKLGYIGDRSIEVVFMSRKKEDLKFGFQDAFDQIQKRFSKYKNLKYQGAQKDLPRSHLPWWARVWEGTSGDRVLDAKGKHRGGVRAIVAPDWVAEQDVKPSPRVQKSILALKKTLDELGIRLGNEKIEDFLKRKKIDQGSYQKNPKTRFSLQEVLRCMGKNLF